MLSVTDGKYTLKIKQDNYAESPREWDGNLGTMICWHRSYTLGDSHPYADVLEFYIDIAPQTDEVLDLMEVWEQGDICDEELRSKLADIVDNDPDIYILPLYLYDHGGITMNTTGFSCSWDSGQVGIIYTTKEVFEKLGCDWDNRKELLVSEVATYDQYIRGDVYGFVITESKKCECCNNVEEIHIDSCWGFYGSDPKTNGMVEYFAEEYQHLADLV